MIKAFSPKTFASVFLALIIATSANLQSAPAMVAFLLILFSAWYLLSNKQEKKTPLNRHEWIWLLSIFAFNIVFTLSTYHNGALDFSAGSPLHSFILAIPIYFLISRIGVDFKILLIGTIVCLIVAGVWSFHQVYNLGISRAEAGVGPIQLAQYVIIFTLFAIYSISLEIKTNVLLKVLSIFAILMGFYAALTSGTRGGWLAVFAVILLHLKYDVWGVKFLTRLSVLLVAFSLVSSTYFIDNFPVQKRVDRTIQNLGDYFSTGKSSSVGQRLEMWKTSLMIIKNDRGLGCGDNCYKPSAQKIFEQGLITKVGLIEGEPHNEYLKVLVEKGIIGLLVMLAMLLAPLIIFLKRLDQSNQPKLAAITGASIILCMLDFMISHSIFDSHLNTLIYGVLIAVLLGQVKHESKQ